MFIIELTYKKPNELIDKYLAEHRIFLDNGYQKNYFVASGPKIPRTGGVIISQLNNLSELESILSLDPFKIHDIADYDIVEFNPTKYHTNFDSFIEKSSSQSSN